MKKFCLSIIGLFFCLLTSTVSAQKIYLKAGDLTANASEDEVYFNYTELSSLQFGITRDANYAFGGLSKGITKLKEIIFTKNVDISSNKFVDNLIGARGIPSIEIITTIPDKSAIKVVQKIELKDAFFRDISSVVVPGCSGDCPAIAESYRIEFNAIRVTTYRANGVSDVIFVYNQNRNDDTF